MKRNIILVTIAIIIVLLALFFLISPKDENSSNSRNNLLQQSNTDIQEKIIEMSSKGFNPSTLTIQKGEKITFKALDSSNRWPASAMHPTHKVYPNSDIEKCGTSEEQIIFDSCEGIPQGQSYEFTFNEIGTWGYHDHLQPSKFGKIIVE